MGQPEKPTDKFNPTSSRTLFSGFGLVDGNSLVGSIFERVRSLGLPGLFFFFPSGFAALERALSSVVFAELGALSNAVGGRAHEEHFMGTLYTPVL